MDFATYKNAGALMALNAVLHFFVFIITGFTPDAMMFVIVGVIYGFLAWGLFRTQRWMAYIVFIVCLCGISAVLSMMDTSSIPKVWLTLIFIIEILLALTLFVILWSKPRSHTL